MEYLVCIEVPYAMPTRLAMERMLLWFERGVRATTAQLREKQLAGDLGDLGRCSASLDGVLT